MDPKETLVLLAAALLWMVLSISLDGHLRILTYVGADCYSKSGARESSTGSYAVSPAFPFSNTRNKFFGIGCDTLALISGVDISGKLYRTRCVSFCNDTDVDECEDPNLNKCLKKCQNTNGNYTCSCPKGYHGDGRKDGEGCSADQLLVVKIVVGVGASVIVLVAVSGLLYFGHQKRKLIKLKEKYFQQNGEDRLFQILEDCIAKEGNVEQVDKVARLVKTCLRVKGEERPTMKEVAMELERLRMVGKHPWTNVESNYEETEYLLGKQIDSSGHGKSGESSFGYQVIGSVVLPSGGR
ncbi:WALL-ASSOCIATED RECEPTOR KINASE-LIKE 21 [Salix koriyanagi]|uniref:WALL-ASSOCIATED RECEPTOR KINASE-LIKE 21 n=1 Tax=Salix koriyanagi TaxID=2511006 RepID=A0A9Q0QM88_9ROSI|nr:WALL-ASSOCIATED RECEPTOR KINASE-LIKE 21 [Salix koriyanagi]